MPKPPPFDPSISIEDRVRQYVVESVGMQTPPSDDDALVDKGFVASIRLLDLVGFLEDTFRVRFKSVDLVPETLGTVRSIADLVRRRLT